MTEDASGEPAALDPEFRGAIVLSWAGLSAIRLRHLLLAVFVAFYVSLFGFQLAVYPLWGPFATVDEQLQYYQVGRNFNEYGFVTTALLPDLSTASEPDEHPYIYNHQPPGPQLLIGLLIRYFGERFELIRVCFGLIFVAGLLAFFSFSKLLRSRGFYGLELAVLLVSPRVVLHSMDHPAYCAFPLVAFLPLVLLHRYDQSGQRWYLAAAVSVAMIGSIYLIYGPLFMIVVFWVLGVVLGIVPVRRRGVAMLVGGVVAGILIHLVQTVVLVGWWVFLQELVYTLSNRMFGVPARQALREFYDSIGFVLYGDHTFSSRRFFRALDTVLSFPGRQAWLVMLLVVVVIALSRDAIWEWAQRRVLISAAFAKELNLVGRWVVWILVAVLTPYFMFPAFASDYPLGGTNGFLMGILAIEVAVIIWRVGRRLCARTRLGIVCVFAVVLWTAIAGKVQATEIVKVVGRIAAWTTRTEAEAGFLWVERNLMKRVVMTNVDPIVAGFFTREIAFGGCHREAVLVDGLDPSKCRIEFVRNFPGRLKVKPTAYVWVGSGNTFCNRREACLEAEHLKRFYPMLFEGRDVLVFDLRQDR